MKINMRCFWVPFVIAFCLCDKIPEIINLRKEKLMLAHGFRGQGPTTHFKSRLHDPTSFH
jgi:hypothetical protein